MSFRLTVALVVILVVLAGFVYFSQRSRSQPGESDERAFMYHIDAESMVGIKVSYQGQEVAFRRTEDGWVFDDEESTPVDRDRFGGLPYLLAGPKAERALTDVEDPGVYGLADPVGTITIISEAVPPIVLEMGGQNADRTERFMRVRGAPEVFMVSGTWPDVFIRLVTEPPYPPPVLIYAGAPEDIVSIAVSYRGQEVRLARTEEGWVFDDPTGAPADQERLDSVLSLLAGLEAVRSIADVTEMATYGLAEPQGVVTVVDKYEIPMILELGSVSSAGTQQYARLRDGTDVFVMDIAVTQALIRLVTEPPYAAQ